MRQEVPTHTAGDAETPSRGWVRVRLRRRGRRSNYPYEEPTTLKSEYFTGRAYVWFDFILPLFALLFLSPKDAPPEVYG